jgi:hypothetical protein
VLVLALVLQPDALVLVLVLAPQSQHLPGQRPVPLGG